MLEPFSFSSFFLKKKTLFFFMELPSCCSPSLGKRFVVRAWKRSTAKRCHYAILKLGTHCNAHTVVSWRTSSGLRT